MNSGLPNFQGFFITVVQLLVLLPLCRILGFSLSNFYASCNPGDSVNPRNINDCLLRRIDNPRSPPRLRPCSLPTISQPERPDNLIRVCTWGIKAKNSPENKKCIPLGLVENLSRVWPLLSNLIWDFLDFLQMWLLTGRSRAAWILVLYLFARHSGGTPFFSHQWRLIWFRPRA